MTDVLTDSFCERCGRRFSLEQPGGGRTGGLGKARLVARGLQRFVLSNDALDEAFEGARRAEEQGRAQAQLHVFHTRFSFCLQCRQYTCADCWNEAQSLCLTCAPLPERAASDPLVQALAAEDEAALAGEGGSLSAGMGRQAWPDRPALDASAWPVADLVESRAPMTFAAEEGGDAVAAEPTDAPTPDPEPASLPGPLPPPEKRAGNGLRALVGRLSSAPVPQPITDATALEPDTAEKAVEAPLPTADPEEALVPDVSEPDVSEPRRPRPSRKTLHRANRRSRRASMPMGLLPERAAEVAAEAPAPVVEAWQIVAPEPAGHESAPEGAGSWPSPAVDPTPAVWPPYAPVYQPRAPRADRPVPQVPPAAWVPRGATPTSVWEASAGPVINRPGSGVRACGSCGLALSASARFCRRCGLRQD